MNEVVQDRRTEQRSNGKAGMEETLKIQTLNKRRKERRQGKKQSLAQRYGTRMKKGREKKHKKY